MNPDSRTRAIALACAAAMAAGIVAIFFWVPTEAFQGPVQRIFYVHVPAAWIAYLAFTIVAGSSIAYLRGGDDRWDDLAHSSAEVGVVFCALNLTTGMLWGRPIWGTYWTWDARLTSMFVLFLVYVGYLVFRALATDPKRGARVAAVIGIVGFVDVPIVHFSVVWWRTLHPARTVINPGGSPQLPGSMLATMLFMLGVFSVLFAILLAMRIRLGRLQSRVSALELGSPDGAQSMAG